MNWPFAKSKKDNGRKNNSVLPSTLTVTELMSYIETQRNKYENTPVTSVQAYHFYDTGILGDAVDTVLDPLLQLKNFVYFNDENDEIEDSKTLEFFKEQCGGDLYESLTQLFTDYLVTGNAFIVLFKHGKDADSGDLYRWEVWPSILVSFFHEGNGAKIIARENAYTVNQTDFISGSLGRLFSVDKEMELIHIRRIANGSFVGKSKVSGIHGDLRVLESLGISNLNQLNNGSIYDLIISVEEDDPQTFEKIKRQVDESKKGPTGQRHMILSREASVTQVGQTNKEGEFIHLASICARRVFNRFNVPLSLKFSDASTFNNVHTSKYMLITDASIPLWNVVMGKFSKAVGRYFFENGTLNYRKSEIPALQDKEHKEVLDLYDRDILSVKEVRKELGYPEEIDDYPGTMGQDNFFDSDDNDENGLGD